MVPDFCYEKYELIDGIEVLANTTTKGQALDVSKNSGTPKSSILIGFSIINHPFWGTPIFWKHPLTQQPDAGSPESPTDSTSTYFDVFSLY